MADAGLVPVAMIPMLAQKGGQIITGHCIAADGPVRSVMLFSKEPVTALRAIRLDDESRTSVTLTKLLAKYFWKINPQWIAEKESFINDDYTGQVLIGDRALAEINKHDFETDLALEWKKFTGLPFVFACWIAMRPLSESELEMMEKAFQQGLDKRDEIIGKEAHLYPAIDLKEYLFRNIRYELTDESRKGLEKFLEMLEDPANQSLLPFSRS